MQINTIGDMVRSIALHAGIPGRVFVSRIMGKPSYVELSFGILNFQIRPRKNYPNLYWTVTNAHVQSKSIMFAISAEEMDCLEPLRRSWQREVDAQRKAMDILSVLTRTGLFDWEVPYGDHSLYKNLEDDLNLMLAEQNLLRPKV